MCPRYDTHWDFSRLLQCLEERSPTGEQIPAENDTTLLWVIPGSDDYDVFDIMPFCRVFEAGISSEVIRLQ